MPSEQTVADAMRELSRQMSDWLEIQPPETHCTQKGMAQINSFLTYESMWKEYCYTTGCSMFHF
jgi:hypothetical protein